MSPTLPPLNALRSFEVCARLGSVALAADELGVTAGAVSQQIRKLEDFFGRSLFVRRNHQLLLTDLGESVYAVSSSMIDTVTALGRHVEHGQARSNLVISTLPSVGVRWLNRRLPEFLARHPEVRIDLRLEEDPVDFFRTRIDVRLAYGEHFYPEFLTLPFLRDRVTVFASPRHAAGLQGATPDRLADSDLIHIDWRTGFSRYPTWESWFELAGHPRKPRREQGHVIDTSSIALDLARDGVGIALGQCWLAQEDLREGTLVAPFAAMLELPYHYCAVHTRANAQNPTVQAFIAWLRQAA